MFEQLEKLIQSAGRWSSPEVERLGLGALTLLLAVSLAAALFISYLYLQFYSGRETGSRIHRAFPLLGLAITAIFICIQFSLPLSLGLLGALSIVRFRTPIKEPEEIGFLMLVIATSIAAATFNLVFVVVFLVVAVVAILVARAVFAILRDSPKSGALILSLDQDSYREKHDELQALVTDRMRRARLESVSTAEDRVVVTYSFRTLPAENVPGFQADLKKLVDPADSTLVFSGGAM